MAEKIFFLRMIPLILLGGVLGGCGSSTGLGPAPGTDEYAEVAQAIARGEDRVSPDDLATWLIEARKDFLLIDVRSTDDFDKGQIETAQHIPIGALVSAEELGKLPKDRRIVVYSNGTENAAQAVVMLRLAGFPAYSLLGGYNYWQERVLNPDLVGSPDAEILELKKRRAIAWYFSDEYDGEQGLPAPPPSQIGESVTTSEPETASIEQGRDDEPSEEEELEGLGLIFEEGC